MGKALITGGAGFIGAWLARRLLADGFRVDVLDDLSRGVSDDLIADLDQNPAFSMRTADLCAPRSLDAIGKDYTHVFHFAARIGVKNVLKRPYAVLRDNIAMLEAVLDLASRQGHLERFFFPSTSEVYAGTQRHFELPIPSPETTPLAVSPLEHPRTSYMLSKIYGEALCQHSGLPFTIIRPHNFYGPRMGLAHVIPQLLQRIHQADDGDELVVYSVEHRRTFCFIDDAVEYVLRLVHSPDAASGTFNVGVQSPEMTMGDLARMLMSVVGREVTVVPGETTPGSPPRRCPDMTRTISATEYTPVVSHEDGVRRTYEWYRDRVFEGAGISAR